jgi:large subunit ribosomal protein L30
MSKTPAKAAPAKTVTVRQTHSVARRTTKQEQILLGLGLKGIGKTKTLEDTPAVRGMIAKVSHLISVTEG